MAVESPIIHSRTIDPTKAVVLYDGQCNFCISQIANIRRFDLWNRLQFVSLHDPIVSKHYPDLSYEQLMEQMWVVAPSGQRFAGAYSLRYLTRALPMLWPLAPAMHLPGLMPFWCWIYRWIAKRRYKIAGRNCSEGTCSLHAGKSDI